MPAEDHAGSTGRRPPKAYFRRQRRDCTRVTDILRVPMRRSDRSRSTDPTPGVAEAPRCPTFDAAVERARRRGPVVALESAAVPQGTKGRHWVAGPGRAVLEWRGGRWRCHSQERWLRDLGDAAPADPFAGLEFVLDLCGRRSPAQPWWAFGYFGYEAAAPADVPRGPLPDAWFLLTDEPQVVPDGPAPVGCADVSGPAPASVAQELFLPSDLDRGRYGRRFEHIRRELEDGNSYQVCFTYQIQRPQTVGAFDLYRALRRGNPAPFAGILEAEDFAIVSSSPERFLRCDADGRVEARPMKGTLRRSGDALEDRRRRRALQRSVKNRAENLMIADLLRNDLARVCEMGSVQVAERACVEEYATVLQMVTSVRGQLAAGRTRAELLAATFPPGSMTGAPKVRTVEILRALEREPRGPYSGILGYWRSDGELDFSVLIRSWVLDARGARCGVGGGVVWDSTCDLEFEETRWKAEPLLAAWSAAVAQGRTRSAAANGRRPERSPRQGESS